MNHPDLQETQPPFLSTLQLLNTQRTDLVNNWRTLLGSVPYEQLKPNARTDFRMGFNYLCDAILLYLAKRMTEDQTTQLTAEIASSERVCPTSGHSLLILTDSVTQQAMGYDATPKLTHSFAETSSSVAKIFGPFATRDDLLLHLSAQYSTTMGEPSQWKTHPPEFKPGQTVEAMKLEILDKVKRKITIQKPAED